jgi:hypothetical protein
VVPVSATTAHVLVTHVCASKAIRDLSVSREHVCQSVRIEASASMVTVPVRILILDYDVKSREHCVETVQFASMVTVRMITVFAMRASLEQTATEQIPT